VEWREEPIELRRYARQNHETGGAKTFVAVPPDQPARIVGYYSISPGALAFARVPPDLTRKPGRYEVPVFRLERLAVDRTMQGQGRGADLLLAAGVRALAVAAEVGGVALAIDAKDEAAARWYERFGALALLDDPLKLILPLTVVADAILAGKVT
jgi:GNAT superfamily N-acetyltransferase